MTESARGVWILAEHREGELEEISFELACEGRRLADKMGEELCAVLVGHNVSSLANGLAPHGIEKVYVVENERLTNYTTDAYAAILSDLIRQHTPSLVMFGETSTGGDLAPRLATRLKTCLVSDCAVLTVTEQGKLTMSKPTYGGRFYTTVVCTSAKPRLVTIRPGTVGLGKIDKSRRAEIIRVDAPVAPENIRTRVRGRIRADPKTVDVSEAQIVVAGGRGAVTANSFDMVWKLADLLGGSVGGTRPAVDSGCIPLERQIGQSGKTISPRLYIACGISGQVHHTVGIKDSKTIIAIDKDRNAPIFKMADLGVVADLSEMFPAIIHAVEDFRRKSQKPVIGGTAL